MAKNKKSAKNSNKTKKRRTKSLDTEKSIQNINQLSLSEADGLSWHKSNAQPFNFRTAYNHYKSWVWACAMLNARKLAEGTIRLYTRNPYSIKNLSKYSNVKPVKKSKIESIYKTASPRIKKLVSDYSDDFVEVTDSPVLDFIYNNRGYINSYENLMLIAIDLQITGSAYNFIEFNNYAPENYQYLQSVYTQVIPDQSGEQRVAGYVYSRDFYSAKTDPEISYEQMIHFKIPNPLDIFYGRSYLESVFKTSSLHLSNLDFRLALSNAMGKPDYIVSFKDSQNLSDKQREAIRDLNTKYKSNTSVYKDKFLGVPGTVSIDPLTMTPKDMLLDSDSGIISEICACFGVPESMLLNNSAKYSSVDKGDNQWLRNIDSLSCLIAETYNTQLLPHFEDLEEDSFLAFDSVVPEDIEELTKKVTVAVNSNSFTMAQIQKIQGQEPDPDLENVYIISGKPFTKEQLMKGTDNSNFNSFIPQKNIEEVKIEEKKIEIPVVKEEVKEVKQEVEKDLNNNVNIYITNKTKEDIETEITTEKIEQTEQTEDNSNGSI